MTQVSYFTSYPNPYYSDWRQAPIPGWGVRPVMAGPRMVAVGGFGEAASKPWYEGGTGVATTPKEPGMQARIDGLMKLLAADKNADVRIKDPISYWRESVRGNMRAFGVNGGDIDAFAKALNKSVKAKYKIAPDLAKDIRDAKTFVALRPGVTKAFDAQKSGGMTGTTPSTTTDTSGGSAADDSKKSTQASVTGSKPIYKETWFLVMAGIAALGVAYLALGDRLGEK